MKTVRRWDDLAEFGIVPLTGEACGLMYRILCDLTDRGKRIVEKSLSVAEIRLHDAWNRGTETEPHIGSIMVSPELMPFLGVFALLEAGCCEVWMTKSNTVIGIEKSDSRSDVDLFQQNHGHELARRFAYDGTRGDRNQHVMSGRIY